MIRTAVPADYPAIGALTVRAYEADGQIDRDNRYRGVLADAAARAAAGELLVAEEDRTGALLGSVLLVEPGSGYAELLRPPAEAELRMLAVDPPAQGHGVGETLARACLERAAKRGFRAVVISTRDFAVSARRLYERLGFTRLPARDWAPLPSVRLIAMRVELPVPDREE